MSCIPPAPFFDACRGRAVTVFAALAIVAAAVAAVPAGLSPLPVAHAAATGLSWSAPTPVLPAPSSPNGIPLNSVSCPSTQLCVTVDSDGRIVTSTDGGSSWSPPTEVDPAGTLNAVSCPSITLCVGVDSTGNALTSANPAGGAAGWNALEAVDPGQSLSTISCGGTSVCVAGALNGDIVSTPDPADPHPAWNVTTGPAGYGRLISVSCVSADLCVGTNTGVMISTNPGAERPSWSKPRMLSPDFLPLSVSCPSDTLCLVGDGSTYQGRGPGVIWSTADPQDGKSADWTDSAFAGKTALSPAAFSCPAVNFCAFASGTSIYVSADPGAASPHWTPSAGVDPNTAIAALSCTLPALCVGVDHGGAVVSSQNVTNGHPKWTLAHTATSARVWTASCAGTALCAIPDQWGDLSITADPVDASPTWASTNVGQAGIVQISCFSAHLCVATDFLGNVLTTVDPTNASPRWTSAALPGTYPSKYWDPATCVSASYCIAITIGGQVSFTGNPSNSHPQWRTARGFPMGQVSAMSCAAANLCSVVNLAGQVTVTTNPTAGLSMKWSATTTIDPNGLGLNAISCPSVNLCVAVDSDGRALISHNPSAATPVWSGPVIIDPGAVLNSVSCMSDSVCVAVDGAGNVVETDDANVDQPAWSILRIDDTLVAAVTCSAQLCLAADDNGAVTIGSAKTNGSIVVTATSAKAIFGHPSPKITCAYQGLPKGKTRPPTPAKAHTTYQPMLPAQSYLTACQGAKGKGMTFAYRSGTLSVQTAPAAITYTGSKSIKRGTTDRVAAKLKAGPTQPVGGRLVRFVVGSRSSASACDAYTHRDGSATCSLATLKASHGTQSLHITFPGDAPGPYHDYARAKSAVNVTVR